MKITAVVVTRNRRPVLEQTLLAIKEQNRPPDRICVIDNASADDTAAAVRDRWPDVDLIESTANLGFPGGLALGCMRNLDSCDALLLLDDDSRPPPEMLGVLEDVLAADPTIGVVGSGGMTLRWGIPQKDQWRWERPLDGGLSVRGVDCCLVDCALVRDEAVRLVGTPDSSLFMMYEDVDFTDRIRRAGYGVVVVAGLDIDRLHLGKGALWRDYYQTRNQLLIAVDRRSATLVVGWAWRTAKFLVASARLQRGSRGSAVRFRLKGAVDGILGRRGMRVDPSHFS